MGYTFKEKITFREYDTFIREYNYLPFMQEYNWAKAKEYENFFIVGVFNNNKLCATAQIIIKKKKRNNLFFIPNGYLLDYANKELVDFMTNNIKTLAHKYHAYVVDIYPCLSTKTNNYEIIHNNLLKKNYKWSNEYIDKSNNLLLPLIKGNKKLTNTEIKKKYDKKDFYSKRGITFEISTNIEDVKRLTKLIDNEYFDSDLVANMMIHFKERVQIIFAKIDLIFYRNFLNKNKASEEDINKISELILSLGEEIDIGCAVIVLPYNNKNSVCEYIYNTEKKITNDLEIAHGLLYEAIKKANHYNCNYVKISNIDLDSEYYIDNYQAIPIKYIGHYSLVINKILYFLNKEIKKKGRN